VRIEASEIIERPPDVVFDFIGRNHVANHPRWDPKMQLWQETPGPIGVGTRVRRRHTRAGTPTEGSMVVTEYLAPRVIAVHIDDGGIEMFGRQEIEPVDGGHSRLTVSVEIPGAPNPLDPMPLATTARNIKELIERET
jgi:hypothetical protein